MPEAKTCLSIPSFFQQLLDLKTAKPDIAQEHELNTTALHMCVLNQFSGVLLTCRWIKNFSKWKNNFKLQRSSKWLISRKSLPYTFNFQILIPIYKFNEYQITNFNLWFIITFLLSP